MTTAKVKAPETGSSNRDVSDKLKDLRSSKDFGGLSDGVTNDTAAINTAIASLAAEYAGGILILPIDTVYTEASLVMNAEVTILDFSQDGKLRILTKDMGSTLPITKGGLEIKTQDLDGILLRVHDGGVADNPYLQVLNSDTGEQAGVKALFTDVTSFHDLVETTTPNAPAANVCRLFAKDNGSGKTQLCARFNTGAVQVIATQP